MAGGLNRGAISSRLDAPRRTPECRTMETETPVGAASLVTADSGTVSITSFATFRRQGGVVLSNLGPVGGELGADDVVAGPAEMGELGADRPGIVAEISSALAGQRISIQELVTDVREAPMAGGTLFEAHAVLEAPPATSMDAVRSMLEAIADELVVEIDLSEGDRSASA